MNYLAHIVLAHRTPELQLGAIIGDLAKGPADTLPFSENILAGIRHHRQVDTFTDQHEAVLRCWARFEPPYRRIASIIVDVAFDLMLTRHWPTADIGDKSLFISSAYESWKPLIEDFPDDIKVAVERWIRVDILNKNDTVPLVGATLRRIQARRPRLIHLHDAEKHVALLEKEIETDFLEFWPEVFKRFA